MHHKITENSFSSFVHFTGVRCIQCYEFDAEFIFERAVDHLNSETQGWYYFCCPNERKTWEGIGRIYAGVSSFGDKEFGLADWEHISLLAFRLFIQFCERKVNAEAHT